MEQQQNRQCQKGPQQNGPLQSGRDIVAYSVEDKVLFLTKAS